MVNDFAVGTLLAFGAATMFGVHTSFVKVKSVRESRVPMPIYNVYFLLGAALTCFIEYFILLGLGWSVTFTYLGIICALLLLCFENFMVLAIQQVGVGYAVATSVFSGSVITPILQIILGQPIAELGIMILGLAMLALAVFLMSVLKDVLKFCGLLPSASPIALAAEQELSLAQAQAHDMGSLDEQTPLVSTTSDAVAQAQAEEGAGAAMSRCQWMVGLIFSSLAGIFLAVLPLPSLYAPPSAAGLAFFLSFGVGCLAVTPLSAVIIVFTERAPGGGGGGAGKKEAAVSAGELLRALVTFEDSVWRLKQVALPAVSAGVVWGVGNICGFCSFLYLSYTIAVSFVQCNVIVAMLLGIVLWKEMTNKVEIAIMFALALLLVAGCVVVLYGVSGTFG